VSPRDAGWIRLVAGLTILLGVGLIAYAIRMSDGSYELALKQCGHLPEKYVPELGWLMSVPMGGLSLLAAVITLFSASRSRWVTIIALGLGALSLLAAVTCIVGMLNAPCPTLD
jgi:hypothetical protein